MSKFERAFFQLTSLVITSAVFTLSILLAGPTCANALSNPLAGKPLGFDDMLPYLNDSQPIYRSGTGKKTDSGDNPLGIVIEPSHDKEGEVVQKDEMSIEDMFGSEQVFPFEPGLGNGGRT